MAIMFRYARRHFTVARIYNNATEAISDIRSGSSIAVGGYMTTGVPENLLKAMNEYGNYNFTVVTLGSSLEDYGINTLIHNKQVKRLITSFIGGSKYINSQYHNGELELELVPNGTLAERVRAHGAGIPGFWTTTGVGTIIEEGGFPIKYKKKGGGVVIQSEAKEKRIFNGIEHIYEEALPVDYSLVKAWKADMLGNLVYRRTAKNFNPDIAICARVTIAEVEEIVPIGSLDPDEIDTPGIFVQRIVKGDNFDKPATTYINEGGDKSKMRPDHDEASLKIAERVAKEMKPGMFVKLDPGIPNLVTNFLAKDIIVASASGIIGVGRIPEKPDPDLIDTHGEPASVIDGGAVVSTNVMMDLLRGGHFDASVVGAFEVSSRGDLANWLIPGVYARGIGSSMDSVANHRVQLIVAMKHTNNGVPKIVNECTLPLTGRKCVKLLVTELGVFDFQEDGINLIEIAKGVTLDEIRAKTACGFTISSDLKNMN